MLNAILNSIIVNHISLDYAIFEAQAKDHLRQEAPQTSRLPDI